MATTRVQINGLLELGEALRLLSDDMQRKVARAATGAAAGIIKKRAKQLAPVAPAPYYVEGNERFKVKAGKRSRKVTVRTGLLVQPGNIAKQIVTKRLKSSQTTLTSVHIVAVRGKREHGYASRIAALQEFGTVKMPAQPFMRPAFEQEKGFAAKAMVDRLKARIDKANKG